MPPSQLQRSRALDLNIRIQRQGLDSNTPKPVSTSQHSKGQNIRPDRLDLPPVLHVHRVHIGKVVHVGQEHVDLDHLVDVGAGGFEDVGEVFDALVLPSGSALPVK
jgi:hypothetical protein